MFPKNMKTGFSNINEPTQVFDLNKIENLLLLFAQKSIILGAHYATCAGRNNLSGTDTIYALQYFAHEFMKIDSLEEDLKDLEESENESSESESSESDIETEDNDYFTKAPDTDPFCKKMNEYHDNWNSWEPTNPIEIILKRNIDKIISK